MFELRPYQQECVDIINNLDEGRYLVVMATGLGKTVSMSKIRRRGRMLILSHRDELVHQPAKYFDCSFGVEMRGEHSNGEEVVSASVQSLVRRLNKFSPDEFDIIITDEAHHAAAKSYRKIYDYFHFRLHIGFTATPNRGDKVRLDLIYDKIIYEKNLLWGIQNDYLTNIDCYQVNIGYDISKVRKRKGDLDQAELEKSVNHEIINRGIARAYQDYAVGQTIIFAASVAHAVAISEEIPGSVVVSAATKNRKEIIEKFTNREINCLINCMIFTEGTDMPLIETVIIARPTINQSLYQQMVGRGLRLSEGKDRLVLIDCVGVSGNLRICTAPSLIGLDPSIVPPTRQKKITGLLTDLPRVIERLLDTPDGWILNAKKIDVFAADNHIELKNINWRITADGAMFCSASHDNVLSVSPVDELGKCALSITEKGIKTEIENNVTQQQAVDRARQILDEKYRDCRGLWDMDNVKIWKDSPASQKQIDFINVLTKKKKNIEKYDCKDFKANNLTKFEASIVIGSFLN